MDFDQINKTVEVIEQNFSESLEFVRNYETSDPDELMKFAMVAESIESMKDVLNTFSETFFMAIALLYIIGPTNEAIDYCNSILEEENSRECQNLMVVLSAVEYIAQLNKGTDHLN